MTDLSRLPGPALGHWEWQLDGACRTEAHELFFHPTGERGPSRARRETAAKAVCATCPVLERCRQHALDAHEPYGVWGGLSEQDRVELLGGGLAAAG